MRVVVIACFAIERHGMDVVALRERSEVVIDRRIALHRTFALEVLHKENGFISVNDESGVFIADFNANNVIFQQILDVALNHAGNGAQTRQVFLMFFHEHSSDFGDFGGGHERTCLHNDRNSGLHNRNSNRRTPPQIAGCTAQTATVYEVATGNIVANTAHNVSELHDR